jgi:hypothetical protein
MAAVEAARKYLYFSERRIRQWFDGSGIAVPEPTRREVTTPSFGNTVPTVRWTKDGLVRTRHYLADLFERTFGDEIVRDLGAPSPIRFAAGVGAVNFGEFIDDGIPVRALIHIAADLDEPSRVAVCLFGSLDNYADFMPDPSVRSHGSWISSAAPDIQRFLHTRNRDEAVLCRTAEDLAREAVRVALFQGDRGPYTDRSKGYNRRFTYGETNETGEWCAEIYSDVDLANTKFGPEEGFSRVLIGAPLWVRTPSLRSVELYADHSAHKLVAADSQPAATGQVTQRP